MHRTSPKLLLVLAATILVVAGVAYGALLWYVHVGKEKLQTAHVAEVTARLMTEQRYLMTRSLKQYKPKLEELSGFFIEEEDIPRFIEKLEALSVETGVRLRLSSLSTEIQPAPVVTLALSADGSYSSVFRFVQAVESLPLRMELPELTVHHAEASSATGGDLLRSPTSGQNEPVGNWSAALQLRVLSFHPKIASQQ